MVTKYFMANRVRELRKEAKLRQEDLAQRVGVSRQTIIALEGGRLANPSMMTCLMIARVLDQPVEYLFYLVPTRDNKHPDSSESMGNVASQESSVEAQPALPGAMRPMDDDPDGSDDRPHAVLDFG